MTWYKVMMIFLSKKVKKNKASKKKENKKK